jgi:peptidoglycan/xylan/chitin deacetylase (PgdA/CDA1 family)/O-antigen ligase
VRDVRRPESRVVSDRSAWVWPAVAGAAVLWTFVAAASGGGAPVPMAASILGVGAAFLIGTGFGGRDRRIVPAVIVVTGLVGLVISTLPALGKGATAGFTGYWNATAAFAVQGMAGSLAVAFLTRGNGARAAALAALAFAAVPFLVQSRAAALGVILVGGAALAGGAGIRGRRVTIAALGLAMLLVLAVTVITGFLGESAGPLGDLVGSRRTALWNDALRAIERSPLTGIGPGEFESVSELARSDKGLGWAHHDFLQQGAETGIPGMLLIISMFGWGLVRLWRVGDRVAVLTSGGLVALGLQASVDYVLHFPVVTIAAAALVGNASSRGPMERPTGSAIRFMRRAGKAATLPFGVASRRGSGDVAILLYHRVHAGTGEISLPREAFEEQIARVAEHERVLTLDQAVDGDDGGVVVTFDDGYRDFHEHALPILVRHGVPATLYLATGLVANGSSPSPEALTWTQLAEAASTGLVTIGSHTHGHADLSRVSEAEAEDEMRRSRDLVEDHLSRPCGHFAYPWAVSSAAADRAARRTFRTAALEAWRTNRRGRIDPYRLGRTPILRSDGPFFFRAKVAGILDGEALVYRALRRGPWRP